MSRVIASSSTVSHGPTAQLAPHLPLQELPAPLGAQTFLGHTWMMMEKPWGISVPKLNKHDIDVISS